MILPFVPADFVREVERAAREGGWTIRYLTPTPAGARPWLEKQARDRVASAPPAARFYLSTGIHGDEIAGPLAVLEMLREPEFFDRVDATIFPILNPEGLSRGTRGNQAGCDLNRDYRVPRTAETRGHVAVLSKLGRYDAALMMHEDYEGTGAYLYELNDGPVPDLGRRIIAALGKHVPIDERREIEEVAAIGGILQRADLIRRAGPIENRPDWPEAIYLNRFLTNVNFTTETPMLQPLEQRVQAQVAGVRALLEVLDSP